MSSSRKRSRDSFDANDKSLTLSEPNQKRTKISTHNHNNNKNDQDETKTEKHNDVGLDEQPNISQNAPVTLNVGGIKYMTTVQTLTGYQSMLKAWFSGNFKIKPSPDGTFFIDRNGKLFEYILEYFRTGSLILPSSWDKTDIWRFYIEVKYFMVKSLFDIILLKLFDSKLITNDGFKLKIINKVFKVLKDELQNGNDIIPMETLKDWKLRMEYDTFKTECNSTDNFSERLEYKIMKFAEYHRSISNSLLLIESNGRIYGLFLSRSEIRWLFNKSFSFEFYFGTNHCQANGNEKWIDFTSVRTATTDELKVDCEVYRIFCDMYPMIIKGWKKGYICCGDLALKVDDEWHNIMKMELWSASIY